MRWTTPAIVALSLFGPVAAWADQPVSASPLAREALTLCASADGALPPARVSILSLGQQRAEEAIGENPQDPTAHFALFCNLGKRAEMRRGALGFFAALGDVGRIRREIDYALALAPDYPAALAAKGQMLTELPVLLGGDPEEGRRLLQRAASLDPDDSRIRSLLADSLAADRDAR
jgi:hypothetical protein